MHLHRRSFETVVWSDGNECTSHTTTTQLTYIRQYQAVYPLFAGSCSVVWVFTGCDLRRWQGCHL